MILRVAVGSLFTECNHLGGKPTDLDCFRRQELLHGPAILDIDEGTVGGMLEVLRQRRCDVRPLIVASACPGGSITAECYEKLKGDLLYDLRHHGPVDGVMLALHGAATSEEVGDVEGDLLGEVRSLVGDRVGIVASLDLHAHVTEAMVQSADALVAWETYPHKDAFSTGARAARLLVDTLQGRCRPAMALAKVPVLVGGVLGHTDGEGPFADIMRFAKSHEGHNGVLSTSVFLVHPYLDLPDMGGGGLVVTDDDLPCAVSLAQEIARRYWERRFDLDPPVLSPQDAVDRGLKIDGQVLLVETADCCGGGAAGDSVHALRALLAAELPGPALAPVVDPEAAKQCHAAGQGAELSLSVGHKLDPQWGDPITVRGRVLSLTDGRFRYSGGIWEGRYGEMGPSAVFQSGRVGILIASHPTYDWADEQFRSVGLDTDAVKFIVVKNPMNHRLGYAGRYRAALLLDTPGPTPATLHRVRYRRLHGPYYPADSDIPGLEPATTTHRSQLPRR